MNDKKEDIRIKEEDLTDIQKAPSKVLAAQVVAYRLVPSEAFKNMAIACMEELSKRRSLGEEFDYEKYIEVNTNIDLPEPVNFKKISPIIDFKF